MIRTLPRAGWSHAASLLAGALLLLGCGASNETTDDWESPAPAVSQTARLEYRIDSLSNENRRMRDQVNVMGAENRGLIAKNTDLEAKLKEAMNAQTTAPAPGGDVISRYESALGQYHNRKFVEAVSEFDGLLKNGIQDNLQDNCHYWIGESYYGLKKYTEAVQHFEMVFNYSGSEKKDDAQLMIGNSYAAMGEKAAAKEAYEKVVSTYPGSRLAVKAQEKMGKLR